MGVCPNAFIILRILLTVSFACSVLYIPCACIMEEAGMNW